jgi:hypothetical protein
MPAAALSLSLSVRVVASPCLLLAIAPEPIARAVNREGYVLPGQGRGGSGGGDWEGVGKAYRWQEGKSWAGRHIGGGKANEKREGKS